MSGSLQTSSRYLQRLFGLAGQTAVVTGGSSGIGREMAAALGQAGSRVILLARRQEPLDEAVAGLSGLGIDAHAVSVDVADADALAAAAATIREKHGLPDIIVNAAGINRRPHMDDLTRADWDATIAVNLTGPFLLGQAFGPSMAARGSGRIINVVSQQSFHAFGNSGAYGVSKAGLVALTRSQAEAWSPRGVLCNALAPGFVHTPLTEPVFSDPQKVAAHAERTMTKRNGLATDFAGAAVFLASPASAAIPGQTIFVDGGYSAT
jgi:NAD(P)-dependent dehydrogenase (short-subunit alcohol dehydrogenase family)